MPSTYDKIATYTVSGSSTTSYTFTSIPSTYTDLVVIAAGTATGGTNEVEISCRFNGDSGSNYSRTVLWGSGSAAGSARSSNIAFWRMQYAGYFNTNQGNAIAHIMNYSNSTTYKTVIGRDNNASLGTGATVSLWRNTNAITSLELYTTANAFGSGSTFTLYGIKAA